jgi:hypothetical protein
MTNLLPCGRQWIAGTGEVEGKIEFLGVAD